MEENKSKSKKTNIDSLITYDITTVAINKLKEDYGNLKVKNVDDRENYKKCYEARMDIKGRRVAVEKRRKELKADSLEFGRKIDGKAKDITARLEGIEGYLRGQQDIVDDEKQRIKEEEEKKAIEKLDARLELLRKYGFDHVISDIEAMPDDEFDVLVSEEKEAFEQEERERIAEEERIEKERQAEQERIKKLEEEREVQAKKIAEQEKENQKLRATVEAKRLEEEKAEQKRLEKERKEREAENRRLQAEVDAKEEERLKEERYREKQEEERAEAEKAVKKKIADNKLFAEIKSNFPTLELSWAEIARLRKKLGKK